MTVRPTILLGSALLLAGVALRAQEPAIRQRTEQFVIEQKLAGDKAAAENHIFEFVTSELMIDGQAVKNAPYSADAVNETTQVLADGNRIVRKSTTGLYRDSEGRTRREQTLQGVGPLAATGDAPQTVFINDPVAGVGYTLNPRERTARKIEMPQLAAEQKEKEERARRGAGAVVVASGSGAVEGAGMVMALKQSAQDAKTESLGAQMIEGVQAAGKRITWTIPAGSIGNERPMQIVSEQWYSPELQALVLSKRSDPRSGDTVYRLTNIRRTEPARALFEVPADYTMREEPSMLRTIEKVRGNER